MGMIFNSSSTLKIIEKLNHRFGSANFGNVNGANRDATVLARAVDTHTKATTLAINLPGADDINRWKKWLDKMDAGGHTQPILDGMIGFLKDNNCVAIEFYAIESNAVNIRVIPMPPQNTSYYGVILVETPTVDSVAGFERRRRRS